MMKSCKVKGGIYSNTKDWLKSSGSSFPMNFEDFILELQKCRKVGSATWQKWQKYLRETL